MLDKDDIDDIVVGSDNWFKLFQQTHSDDASNDKAIRKLQTKLNTIIEKMGLEVARHIKVRHDLEAELDEIKTKLFKLIGGE